MRTIFGASEPILQPRVPKRRPSSVCNPHIGGKIYIRDNTTTVEYSNMQLTRKVQQLEEQLAKITAKLADYDKWVYSKKRKFDPIEWLNNNVTPTTTFDTLSELICIDRNLDVQTMFDDTIFNTFQNIFKRTIIADDAALMAYPITAFTQKPHHFYAYDGPQDKWVLLSKDRLVKLLNRINHNLFKSYRNWKLEHEQRIANDNHLSNLCDKTSAKLNLFDFKNESTFMRMRYILYQCMKRDVIVPAEYDNND